MEAGVLERLLLRDRAIVIAALVAVSGFSWLYVLIMATHGMMAPAGWSAPVFAAMGTMWIVMMLAMMLPSAAPMLLLFASMSRRQSERGEVAVSVGAFALGYVAVWIAFSLVATALQWALSEAALLSAMMKTGSHVLAGSLLIAAGVYQWTPLKQACLRKCRSPLDFLMTRWRKGLAGNFVMGVEHGAYCLGCCWLLMLLLFVGGVMSLAWIATLAAFVLVEKIAPAGHWAGRAAGVALALWGVAVLARLA